MDQFFKTVTFVRHGQSEQNVIKPLQVSVSDAQIRMFRERDSGDHRLTDRGLAEARAIGKLLHEQDIRFTLLATSTYLRTQETLLATGFEGRVEVTPLLDERHTGYHEHLLHEEANARFPCAMQERHRSEVRWRPDNGESMRDVLVRMLLFVGQLDMRVDGAHTLAISHSRAIASFMWWAEQLEEFGVPGSAGTEQDAERAIVNGQAIQYGWSCRSLRPTHARSFVPGNEVDLSWRPLAQDSRFMTADLWAIVHKHPRILE